MHALLYTSILHLASSVCLNPPYCESCWTLLKILKTTWNVCCLSFSRASGRRTTSAVTFKSHEETCPSIIPWCCWRVNSSINWQTQNWNHFRFCRNTFDIFCPSRINKIRLCFIYGEKACTVHFFYLVYFYNTSVYMYI